MLSRKTVFISLSILLILFSCKKLELNRINKISTDGVSIANTTVNAKGTIIDISGVGIYRYGHCWATNPTPTINDSKTEFENPETDKAFTSSLTNLSANVSYYVCSYATNNEETVYGEIKTIKISSITSLSVDANTLPIENEDTLLVNGTISNLGSLKAINYGHCWATHTSPTINDHKNSFGSCSEDKNFVSPLSGLTLETTYYIRAYVELDSNTIIYSDELTVSIPDLTVTTDNFSISGTTATLQGTIVKLGVSPVIDHGHCWSTTTSNPNINDNVISKGITTSTGLFYANLTGLISGKTYYYRAFARKGNTLRYGVVKSFSN